MPRAIVAINPPSARAAKDATKTIPIVMRSTDDPVMTGLVASRARPGGNITGLTSISTELHGKRLELLKDVVRRTHVVAVIHNPTALDASQRWKELEAAGRALQCYYRAMSYHPAISKARFEPQRKTTLMLSSRFETP